MQSLIDEGRITEDEARVHPHRNLILKALDGIHDAEPDLFMLELVAGDRLFLCSDGACGVLTDGRIADILSMGSPDYAAVELVRASLEAGSSDNVTCVVADVLSAEQAAADEHFNALEPMLVGAAAELKRRMPRGLFRGHRSGDTGEMSRSTPRSSTTSRTRSTPTRSTPRRRGTRRSRRAGMSGPSGCSSSPSCSGWSGSASRPPGRGPRSSTTSASRTGTS